jgi:predicted MPP superfamily phosphohydrolase
VLLVALILGLWAFVFEPASLTAPQYRLAIPHWSSGLSGLRVAVLADLHVGSPFNGIAKLERIVDLTNELKPDLIVIPGDLVIQVPGGTFVAPEATAAVLSRLTAPLGVWACLGNHDWWLDGGRVTAALERVGIRVLDDGAVRIERRGSPFWLLGITDFLTRPHNVQRAMAQVTDDAPVLMFTHNPDVFPTIRTRFSLVIAGHTHGGQVAFPLVGRLIVPSRYGQRYAIGHIVEDGRHLFVSTGLGTSLLPVRFRVPPEVSFLELLQGEER